MLVISGFFVLWPQGREPAGGEELTGGPPQKKNPNPLDGVLGFSASPLPPKYKSFEAPRAKIKDSCWMGLSQSENH